jgi:hypothetical protein
MGPATEFFGVTESPAYVANENRVAFRTENAAGVDRVAEVAMRAAPAKSKARWIMNLVITPSSSKTHPATALKCATATEYPETFPCNECPESHNSVRRSNESKKTQ